MNNIELRNRLLLSTQRALLGKIYPSIRAIAIGFNELDNLIIKMYLDKSPNEDDYEELSDITGEILADIEFNNVKELCEYSESKIDLGGLDAFVYMRKE
jgi:hypothetical protein